MYDHILRVILTTSEASIRDLIMEMVTINRNKYDSLIAYQSRLVYLRDKLKNIGVQFDDRAHIILAIEGLRQTYPNWYFFWIYEFEKGTLTWESLMEDLLKKGSTEISRMSMRQSK
jgi:hypothetical protein